MADMEDILDYQLELTDKYKKLFGDYPPINLMLWSDEGGLTTVEQIEKAIEDNKPITIDPPDIPTDTLVY